MLGTLAITLHWTRTQIQIPAKARMGIMPTTTIPSFPSFSWKIARHSERPLPVG
jgi:hypothetical protein